MHIDRRLAFIATAAGGMILLAGCGAALAPAPSGASTTAQKASTATSDPCAADPTLCAAAPTDTPLPAATADTSLTGPIGTAYTDTDSSGNVMAVTLTGVTDPARGVDSYTTPNNGFHFVATKFSITGVTGTFASDANSDAVVIGSDGQTYSFDVSDVRGCTNFNYGSYSVGPTRTSVGCVVFQVPNGVKVSQVQWGSMFGGTPAIWTI
jgi:hypothetical protein